MNYKLFFSHKFSEICHLSQYFLQLITSNCNGKVHTISFVATIRHTKLPSGNKNMTAVTQISSPFYFQRVQ